MLDFADGQVHLVGVRARRGGLLVGQALRTLREHLPDADARVAAIYRDGRADPGAGDTVIAEERRGVLPCRRATTSGAS